MADMQDAASDQNPDEPGREPDVDQVPDRRNTIDLVRVERGEPERRALRRPPVSGSKERPAKPSEESE